MKKTLFMIITTFTVTSLLLSGCSQSKQANANVGSTSVSSSSMSSSYQKDADTADSMAASSSSSSSSIPKSMQQALRMTDQELVNQLAGLDLCVASFDEKTNQSEGLTFSDSKDISSDLLFTFFSYITSSKEYPEQYYLKWYNEKEQKFHVPIDDIEQVLNKYFEHVNFDSTKIGGYNEKTNCIDRYIDGFGGANFPKLLKKDKISDDTLRITIKYYTDTDYNEIRYIKAYTIKYTDNGYKYLSIEKM